MSKSSSRGICLDWVSPRFARHAEDCFTIDYDLTDEHPIFGLLRATQQAKGYPKAPVLLGGLIVDLITKLKLYSCKCANVRELLIQGTVSNQITAKSI